MKNKINCLLLAAASFLSFLCGIAMQKLFTPMMVASPGSDKYTNTKTKASERVDSRNKGFNGNLYSTEVGRLTILSDHSDLMKRDPGDALASLRAQLNGRIDEKLIRSLFEEWAEKDMAAAFSAALLPENRDIQLAAVDAVLGAALANSPATALDMLFSLQPSGNSQWLCVSLFTKIAQQDINFLKSDLGNIKSPIMNAMATSAIAREYGQTNPEEGLRWIESLKGRTGKEDALASLVNGWAKSNPKAAAAYLDSQDSSTITPGVSTLLLSQWALSDPMAAFNWANSIKGVTERQFALSKVVIYMQAGSCSSQEVLEAVNSLPPGRTRDDALANIIYNWKGDDFLALAKTAYAEGSDVPGGAAEAALAQRWVKSNYQEAAEFLNALSGADSAPALLREVTSGMIQNEPLKAVAMISETAADGDLTVVPSALESFFRSSPESAKEFLKSLEGSPRYNEVLTMFSSAYAKYNPMDAYEWIGKNIGSELQPRAVRVVIDQWVKSEQDVASIFIGKLPPSESRDVASSVLAVSVAGSDLTSALQWVTAIRNDQIRRDSLGEIRKYIDFRNPNKFAESVQDSGMASEDIRYLEKGP